MQLRMDGSQVTVQNGPQGLKLVTVTDARSGLVVVIPLLPESAKTVGAALSTSLYVAGGPLPSAPPKGNGH